MNHIPTITHTSEIDSILSQIEATDKMMPFIDTLMVHPYGRPIPFKKVYDNVRHWREYTQSSQSLLVEEMNGCIRIINSMIDYEAEPKISVRILEGPKAGHIVTMAESLTTTLVEAKFVEIVKETV